MLIVIFSLALMAALLLLWGAIDSAHPKQFREIRITGVDYYHSQGRRFWDNYNPKRDLVLVVNRQEVIHEINPDNVIGTSLQERVIQYRDEGSIKTLAVERFLGPPNCIRVNHKIIINQF